MTKRILTRIAFLAVLAAAGFFLLVWWVSPSNVVNEEKYKHIVGGMTEAEVRELLGEPSSREPELQRINRKIKRVEIQWFGSPAVWTHIKEWPTDEGKRIGIGFDDGGKVTMAILFQADAGFLGKMRQLMRL